MSTFVLLIIVAASGAVAAVGEGLRRHLACVRLDRDLHRMDGLGAS